MAGNGILISKEISTNDNFNTQYFYFFGTEMTPSFKKSTTQTGKAVEYLITCPLLFSLTLIETGGSSKLSRLPFSVILS